MLFALDVEQLWANQFTTVLNRTGRTGGTGGLYSRRGTQARVRIPPNFSTMTHDIQQRFRAIDFVHGDPTGTKLRGLQ